VKKTPLENLFFLMFKGKYDFSDFIDGAIESNYETRMNAGRRKNRLVFIPNQKLKDYHEFLRLFLLDYLPVNEQVVYSYRKGVSAYNAVALHSESKYFFACDIADFFSSITRDNVKKTILGGLANCPILDANIWIERILDLLCIDGRIPIGFSTSPTISNATLLVFDNALQEYCHLSNLIYSRYSDDIIISTKEVEKIQNISEVISSFLRELLDGEISLNLSKSRMLRVGQKIKLLGMVLLPNGHISVDAKIKSEIEVLLHCYFLDKNKANFVLSDDWRGKESRLAGLLNYVNTIDQRYLNKLRKKFGVTIVDRLLHRSFG
jgi:RNA-directed DNA polymerase